ncbi:MAG: L-serine ammonia-lyase, partial [Maritimibacter sp.]|nr:L-serine ammonia-lyase [Maritimibacter sp.]
MFLSVFEMFKIGIGPSSSHTMGPMVAAGRFLDQLRASAFTVHGLRATLHGSLAHTGVGHATDRAVILGLAGFLPDSYDPDAAEAALAAIMASGRVSPPGLGALAFAPETDLVFDKGAPLPGHANGLQLMATDAQGDVIVQETYYSIGGGFVVTAAELAQVPDENPAHSIHPFPFETADRMLEMARASGKSIAEMKRANERIHRKDHEIDEGLARIWEVMNGCIARGLDGTGILPGGLGVKRRAAAIHARLKEEAGLNIAAPHIANEWMSVFAMAVNEENAAGGQVVTAPTNGAAGVVPAVIRYWLEMMPGATASRIPEFLLTAAAIGGLIKHNASIS